MIVGPSIIFRKIFTLHLSLGKLSPGIVPASFIKEIGLEIKAAVSM
jgi:hypothetical protein